MDKPFFVLDSMVVINHLNHKFDIDNFLANTAPDAIKIVSIVTYIETLAKPGMAPLAEQEALVFLASCKIEEISPAIRDETVRLRRINPQRKLPDYIIAATAVALKTTLLSNDPHLINLVWPGLVVKRL
ncbi:MAG: PIN domain-containing protein [Treponema sp.]|jgi:predicted nucleic acid-binding protein|nr:PIN domain-containing protein [Treponema sp.]